MDGLLPIEKSKRRDPLKEASAELLGLARIERRPPATDGLRPLPPLWENGGRETVAATLATDDRSLGREFVDSFLHSLGPQNMAMLGAGLRAMGTTIQNRYVHELGYKVETWGEGLDMGKPGSVPSIEDIESIGSALRWASGGLGQGLGSIGMPLAGGGLSFAAGSMTGNPKVAAGTGILGMFATNELVLAGEALQMFERSGVDPLQAAKAAHAIAPAMAAIDTLGLTKLLQGPVRKARQSLLRYVGRYMVHGGKVEGLTEMGQGIIRQATDAHLTGEPKVAERALEVINETLIAGMTGGVVGLGAGVVRRNRRAAPKPTEPAAETPEPEPVKPAPEPESDKAAAEEKPEFGDLPAEETQTDPERQAAIDEVKTQQAANAAALAKAQAETDALKAEADAAVKAVRPEVERRRAEAVEAQKTPDRETQEDLPVTDEPQKAAETTAKPDKAAPGVARDDADAIQAEADTAATSPRNDLPEPTDAQKEAGNYKKGHVIVQGLDVSIENPKGSERSGTAPDGKKWSVKMPAHYGYVKRTEGADGDQVDVYLGDQPDSDAVFVVDQVDAETGEFDEHKVFIGYSDPETVRTTYDAAFDDSKGPDRRQYVTKVTMAEFKAWLKDGDTTKPVNDLAIPAFLRRDREPAAPATKPAAVATPPAEDATPALPKGKWRRFGVVLGNEAKAIGSGHRDVLATVGRKWVRLRSPTWGADRKSVKISRTKWDELKAEPKPEGEGVSKPASTPPVRGEQGGDAKVDKPPAAEKPPEMSAPKPGALSIPRSDLAPLSLEEIIERHEAAKVKAKALRKAYRGVSDEDIAARTPEAERIGDEMRAAEREVRRIAGVRLHKVQKARGDAAAPETTSSEADSTPATAKEAIDDANRVPTADGSPRVQVVSVPGPAAQPEPEPTPELPAEEDRTSPDDSEVITATGRRVKVRPEVVELDTLVASHTREGTVNPDFPQALQPRDRSRVASQTQIQKMAADLTPELLMPAPQSSEGAPIVGQDNVVESGNARVIAIRHAYESFPEQAAKYKAAIEAAGYDTAGMERPVLVQRRTEAMTPEQRAEFAREANARTTAERSESELAGSDAAGLNEDITGAYKGGDVGHALNRPFVRLFMEAIVPETERAGMVTSDGVLSQAGRRRIENALFAKAYGDPALLARLREDSETAIKSIGQALIEMAPAWARMRAMIEAGDIDPAMDTTEHLMAAVRLIERARREGQEVRDLVNQIDAFSGIDGHPFTEKHLRLMFWNTDKWVRQKGQPKIVEGLMAYVEEALEKPPGPDMFGATADPAAVLALAEKKQRAEEDLKARQAELLGRRADEGVRQGVSEAGRQRDERGGESGADQAREADRARSEDAGEPQSVSTAARDAGQEAPAAGRKMSRAAVERIVQGITEKWDAARLPAVHILDTVDELPAQIASAMPRRDDGTIHPHKALLVRWHTGRADVYIFAATMESPADVRRSLAHEVVGHFSMREMLGDAFGPILTQVWKDRNTPRLRPFYEEVAERYGDLTEDEQAEETIALMAEKRAANPVMTRAIAAVRRVLRALGFRLSFTYDEIMSMLARAERRLRRAPDTVAQESEAGAQAAVGEPAMDMQARQVRAMRGMRDGWLESVRFTPRPVPVEEAPTVTGATTFTDETAEAYEAIKNARDPHVAAGRWVVEKGKADGFEHYVVFDVDSGAMTAGTSGKGTSATMPDIINIAARSPQARLVLHHNHPDSEHGGTGGALSPDDMAYGLLPGVASVVAHTYDGRMTAMHSAAILRGGAASAFRDKVRDLHRQMMDAARDLLGQDGFDVALGQTHMLDILNRALADNLLVEYRSTVETPDTPWFRRLTAVARRLVDGTDWTSILGPQSSDRAAAFRSDRSGLDRLLAGDSLFETAGQRGREGDRVRRGPAQDTPPAQDGSEGGVTQSERQGPSAVSWIEPTRPVETLFRGFFRILTAPVGSLDAAGDFKLGKKAQEATRKAIRELRPAPDGMFRWLDNPLEIARHGWLNRYGTPKEFILRERMKFVHEFEIMQDLVGVLQGLEEENIGFEEAKALQEILEGKELNDARLARLAQPIRERIDAYGKQLVEMGLLPEGAYLRNLGEYLHRSYRQYEFDAPGIVKWARKRKARSRAALRGDEFMRRGRRHRVSMRRMLKDVPERFRKEAAKVTKWEIFDKTVNGRVVKRAYKPAGPAGDFMDIPVDLSDFVSQGVWDARREKGKGKGGRFYLWRDWSESEREAMGEIRDARYNLIKTYELLSRDISTGRFFEDIAQNPAWFTRQQPDGEVIDASDTNRLSSVATVANVDWVKVPDTLIPKSSTKRWGALAGGYIRASIWRDLNELQKMQNVGAWGWLLREWKKNKTSRSPTVHFNNTIGNVVLAELYDFTVPDLIRGLKEFASQGTFYQEALQQGIFNSGYVRMELNRQSVASVIDRVIKEVEAAEGIERTSMQRVYDLIRGFDRKMGDVYRWEDEVFRIVSYMRDRHRGMLPAEAAQNAIDRFLNYDIRAPWPNALRRTVFPFLSYTYAFVPQWLKAMSNKPWKIAKIFALGYALQALAYEVTDGDEDEERRVMAERDLGWTWAGLPKMLRLPFTDQDDPVYLGMTRILPGGGLADTEGNPVGVPEWMMISGPMLTGMEVLLNRIGYTSQDMVEKTDTTLEKAEKRMAYLWRATMPNAPWVPGSWNWKMLTGSIMGETDIFGRAYSLPMALVRQVGPRVYPFDVDSQRAYRLMAVDRERQEYRRKLRELAMDRNQNRISKWAYDRGISRVQVGLEELQKRAARVMGHDE